MYKYFLKYVIKNEIYYAITKDQIIIYPRNGSE